VNYGAIYSSAQQSIKRHIHIPWLEPIPSTFRLSFRGAQFNCFLPRLALYDWRRQLYIFIAFAALIIRSVLAPICILMGIHLSKRELRRNQHSIKIHKERKLFSIIANQSRQFSGILIWRSNCYQLQRACIQLWNWPMDGCLLLLLLLL
jgi:hypothetical protein